MAQSYAHRNPNPDSITSTSQLQRDEQPIFIPPSPSSTSRFLDNVRTLDEKRGYFLPPQSHPSVKTEEWRTSQREPVEAFPNTSGWRNDSGSNHSWHRTYPDSQWHDGAATPWGVYEDPFQGWGKPSNNRPWSSAYPRSQESATSWQSAPPPPPPHPPDYSMFSNASHFTIVGGLFANVGGDVNNNTRDSSTEIYLDQYLRGFCSMTAAFNSGKRHPGAPRCIPETRTQVIDAILRWAANPSSPGILWLSGLAGEGKTAVAQTIAERLSTTRTEEEPAMLAGSYFFSRGQDDRRQTATVFTTLAYQLARYDPALKDIILEALQEDSSIPHASLAEQYIKLIVEPVREVNKRNAAQGEPPLPMLVFVIDALDQCDDPESILTIIADSMSVYRDLFHFFVASRPESQVRDLFSRPTVASWTKRVSLRNSNTKHDIEIYLTKSFSDVRRKRTAIFRTLNRLKTAWPEEAVMEKLVVECDGLFIYASIIVQYVSDDHESPIQRLQRFLTLQPPPPSLPMTMPSITADEKKTSDDPYKPLDRLYTDILSAVKGAPGHLRDVLGALMVLFTPLTEPELALLIASPDGELTEDVMLSITDQLHSIVVVPWDPDDDGAWDTQPIRLYHKSIHEFLADRQRSAELYINPSQKHGDLAILCLNVMSRELRHNPCGLKHPDSEARNLDIRGIEKLCEKHIPVHLRYACRFWWRHMCSAVIDGDRSHQFEVPLELFLNLSLLKWIESLSLLGDLSVALQAIRAFGDQEMQRKFKPQTATLIADCGWLLLGFYLELAKSSYSVYDVTLNQAPRDSVLRRLYRKSITWYPHREVVGVTRTWGEHFHQVITHRIAHSASVHPLTAPPNMLHTRPGTVYHSVPIPPLPPPVAPNMHNTKPWAIYHSAPIPPAQRPPVIHPMSPTMPVVHVDEPFPVSSPRPISVPDWGITRPRDVPSEPIPMPVSPARFATNELPMPKPPVPTISSSHPLIMTTREPPPDLWLSERNRGFRPTILHSPEPPMPGPYFSPDIVFPKPRMQVISQAPPWSEIVRSNSQTIWTDKPSPPQDSGSSQDNSSYRSLSPDPNLENDNSVSIKPITIERTKERPSTKPLRLSWLDQNDERIMNQSSSSILMIEAAPYEPYQPSDNTSSFSDYTSAGAFDIGHHRGLEGVKSSRRRNNRPLLLTWHDHTDNVDAEVDSDADSYHTAEEDNDFDGREEQWEWNYSITPPDGSSPSGSFSPHLQSGDLSDWRLDDSDSEDIEDLPVSPPQHPFWRRKYSKNMGQVE